MSRADVREDSDKGRSEMARATTWSRDRKVRFAATTMLAAITLTVVAAVVPTVVTAEASATLPAFRNRLAASSPAAKLTASADQPLAAFTPRARTATTIEPVATSRPSNRSTSTTRSTGSAAATPVSSGDELAEAQSILAGLIGRYPILAGASVSIGDASGYQSVAYYKSGRIVISATHTASLSRILNHEVWHIIDWRDNGVIDWGENVPPQ